MENSSKIMRRAIYTFLQNYQYFTLTSALLAFPYSVSLLISNFLVPSSSLLQSIHDRLTLIFQASSFPYSSHLFTILSFKLSQTLCFCIFSLPFTFTFFLLAKASVFNFIHQGRSLKSSFISLYKPLFDTQICNFFLIISANATSFSVLFFVFNLLDGWLLLVSAFGAVFYSGVLANTIMISNLALVSSGIERNGGYLSILKACVVIKGRTSTALTLAFSLNLTLAAIEALFHYRVVRVYYSGDFTWFTMALEGILIAYLYSMILVLDTVVSCKFFESCKTDCLMNMEASKYCYRIEIAEEDGFDYVKLKNIETSAIEISSNHYIYI